MSNVQYMYEMGNAELNNAINTLIVEQSTNHATIACACYLKSITEMLGNHSSEPKDQRGESV